MRFCGRSWSQGSRPAHKNRSQPAVLRLAGIPAAAPDPTRLPLGLRGVLRGLRLLLNSREQFGERQVQPFGNRQNRLDGQIAFATLDPAHVGSVQPTVVGERFL